MALTRLTLADYSDRELLAMVEEVCQRSSDDFATSQEVAEALDIEAEYPARSTGSRLGRLRSWGMVTVDPERVQSYWQLTSLGRAIAFGKPRQATVNALDSATQTEVVMLARLLGRRHRALDEGTGRIMQREFRRQWMNGN